VYGDDQLIARLEWTGLGAELAPVPRPPIAAAKERFEMSMKLEGKVALVTGGAGGIGSAICRVLAAEGASIAVHYNTSCAAAHALVEELHDDGKAAAPFQAELTEESETISMVATCVEAFGRLDVLVNNAGHAEIVPLHDLGALTDELIEKTLRIKLHAPLYVIRAARPHLERGAPGQIVNITSVAGIAARGGNLVYSAANAALANMTRSLARALAPKIRVNAVAPGFVETGLGWQKDSGMCEAVSRRNYIGRTVEPHEVAEVVRFLCTSAPAMTGEEIALDGGIGRLWPRS
jgi:3-oxoacyl-[acyl-carrier protein] reductase